MRILTTLAAALALTVATGLAAAGEPNLEWADVLSGEGGLLDDGFCALVDPEGHLIVAGESADADGGTDMYIRKLRREDADQLWDARYESFDGNDMAVTGLSFDPFGDVLVGGYIRGCVG